MKNTGHKIPVELYDEIVKRMQNQLGYQNYKLDALTV